MKTCSGCGRRVADKKTICYCGIKLPDDIANSIDSLICSIPVCRNIGVISPDTYGDNKSWYCELHQHIGIPGMRKITSIERKLDWRDEYHLKICEGRDKIHFDWRERLNAISSPCEKLSFLEYIDNAANQNRDKNGIFSKIIKRFVENVSITA